eukprot:6005403-Prymnesium_polylepis.2
MCATHEPPRHDAQAPVGKEHRAGQLIDLKRRVVPQRVGRVGADGGVAAACADDAVVRLGPEARVDGEVPEEPNLSRTMRRRGHSG